MARCSLSTSMLETCQRHTAVRSNSQGCLLATAASRLSRRLTLIFAPTKGHPMATTQRANQCRHIKERAKTWSLLSCGGTWKVVRILQRASPLSWFKVPGTIHQELQVQRQRSSAPTSPPGSLFLPGNKTRGHSY